MANYKCIGTIDCTIDSEKKLSRAKWIKMILQEIENHLWWLCDYNKKKIIGNYKIVVQVYKEK